MIDNFIVEEITKKDLKNEKEFARFINSLVEEKAQVMLKSKKSIDDCKDWLEEIWEKSCLNQQLFLLAKINQEIVGVAEVFIKDEVKDHLAEVAISVKRGYRNKGIGSELLNILTKTAKEKFKDKVIFLYLTVFSTNKKAINFYQKFGFEMVAEVPNQLQLEEDLVSEVVMMKKI